MMQQETGGLKESEDGTVDPGTPTDDDEITIPSEDRNRKILDFPDNDIRDEQTLSNTQREDWLLPIEPMHGARPRQTGREDPPAIDNRPPIDATGGPANGSDSPVVARSVDFDGRGGDHTVEGGRPAPEPQGAPRGGTSST